jgi:transposase
MPRERLSMRTIREVLRLKNQGLSQRSIAVSCHISDSTVREYLYRAASAGIVWPLPDEMTDELLEERLFPTPAPAKDARPFPDWNKVTVELRRKGVTLFLLWEEYRALYPEGYGYSRYCELHQDHSKTLDPRMRQVHRAGEKVFVDYAGLTMRVVDRRTGEVREVQIFVGTLGASDYTYAEGTWTQGLTDWIGSHVRMLEHFGASPEIIVLDNLKAGVTAPCRYEPDINPTYLDFAQHYGIAVMPARVRKPRDKGKVENHVLSVERRIIAPLRDRVFFSLDELNAAIHVKLDELNERPFQKLPTSRRKLFEELDAPALRPLPTTRYVLGLWKKVRVNIDYHVEVDKGLYSVPYKLLRKELDARLTDHIIEIFFQGNRIASHARSYVPGYCSTDPLHMPKGHRDYAEWTPERLVRWANETGAATAGMVDAMMQKRVHPQQAFRSCLGVMGLAKKYGADRLEAACRRGLLHGAVSYRSVKSILETRLDQEASPPAETSAPLPVHVNIRGADYYQASLTPDCSQTTLSFAEERNDSSC